MNASDEGKGKAIEDLLDEVKRKAIEAAFATKDIAETRSLKGATETTEEMRTGSPKSPGYDEHSGKTMKPAAQWPGTDFSPEPTPLNSKATEFDKALAAAQQQEPKESPAQDKGHDLDR